MKLINNATYTWDKHFFLNTFCNSIVNLFDKLVNGKQSSKWLLKISLPDKFFKFKIGLNVILYDDKPQCLYLDELPSGWTHLLATLQ